MEIKLNKERAKSTVGYMGSIQRVIHKLMFGFCKRQTVHTFSYI